MKPTIVKIAIAVLLLGIVLVVALNWQRIFFGRQSVPLEGSLVHYDSFSSEFVEQRPFDVWLPEGYDPESSDRYAVVYMHDGQFLFDHPTSPYFGTVWIWDVDKAMTRLIREHKIRPAIVVSIWNLPDTKRRTEYMPQKPVTEEAGLALKAEGSDVTREAISSDNYLRFLVEELKPFIDENYATYTDPANTFVIGSSMGGMISAYAIAEYPDVFGGSACMSTHFSMAGGVVLDWYQSHWPDAGTNRVYFDFGTETLDADYEPYQLLMDDVMRAKGFQENVDWMTRKYEGHDHSPKYWRERLHIPLEFLLGSH
jgi:predicted alpha/beta superfamily hydrolase